jgi:catechol 2,3-dioxygenase-like lactoylglutathione lyase family enzyme
MAHPRIRGLDHLVLRVRDLERSRAFYCDVIGCSVDHYRPKLGLMQLRAGTALIDLVPIDGRLGRIGGAPPEAEGRNVDHFCLQVDSLDMKALAAHLRAHGVEPGEVEQRYGADGTGPSIYVRDPDGNTVELKGPPVSQEKPADR